MVMRQPAKRKPKFLVVIFPLKPFVFACMSHTSIYFLFQLVLSCIHPPSLSFSLGCMMRDDEEDDHLTRARDVYTRNANSQVPARRCCTDKTSISRVYRRHDTSEEIVSTEKRQATVIQSRQSECKDASRIKRKETTGRSVSFDFLPPPLHPGVLYVWCLLLFCRGETSILVFSFLGLTHTLYLSLLSSVWLSQQMSLYLILSGLYTHIFFEAFVSQSMPLVSFSF